MASLTKTTTNGKVFFRLQFNAGGKRRTLHLGSIRESAANKIKARIEDLVTDSKLKTKPDETAQQWILEADFETVEKLAGWGLLDSVSDLLQRRRNQENPDLGNKVQRPTLLEFCQWYILQRKSDCEKSTIQKITSSLNMLCDYCRDHETITTVDDVNSEMAFRYQLHRQKDKAEATVSKDVKIAKTCFSYGLKAGQVSQNPFQGLKAGSDVNLDGQFILPISDYDKLIDDCTDSDWRTIIALARLGGLRCPSELTHLKWPDVNWHARTIRITATKTKRYGKTERIMPMFDRLEQALSDHWELTGEKSEYVITKEHLRRSGVSLSERFHEIRKSAGVPKFDNPFRNMRLSAVNDVCRIPGITPKTIVDWFGHDLKTALKHYNRTTCQDFDHALKHDPFRDSVIAKRESGNTGGNIGAGGNTGGNTLHQDETQKPRETEASRGIVLRTVTPTGLEPVLPA